MKLSKILILVVTLSFPVILYLFLTFYGSNEFDLPVYFEETNEFCPDFKPIRELKDSVFYSDDQFKILGEVFTDQINIAHFPNVKINNKQLKNELSRLLLTLSSEVDLSVNSFYLKDDVSAEEYLLKGNSVNNYQLKSNALNDLINCHLTLPTASLAGSHPAEMTIDLNATLILIDQNARIRGYYNGLETKDVDRLILEIRILATKLDNQ